MHFPIQICQTLSCRQINSDFDAATFRKRVSLNSTIVSKSVKIRLLLSLEKDLTPLAFDGQKAEASYNKTKFLENLQDLKIGCFAEFILITLSIKFSGEVRRVITKFKFQTVK